MTSTLKLVCERKIGELLPGDKDSTRWEASGVLAQDGQCFVVFDDRTEVARVDATLKRVKSNKLLGMSHGDSGYEGIAFNAADRRYYLLVEAREHAGGHYKAVIVEFDDEFAYLKERSVDFSFRSENKGFEAVAWLERDGVEYLLALCEGNKCACGSKGRKPGGGRVQVFEKAKKEWKHVRTIELPKTVPFEDYSGMSIRDGRMAVVSQVSSRLWVGQFKEDGWSWQDNGRLYEFPRQDDGSIHYGNIEGVAWITRTRVVTVSDRRKRKEQPDKRIVDKDQSIHVFQIPR